ncbi:MAG: hypothetical protein QG612_273 [Pseudomonadota bacterium]|nr:hypothetical protein [Pseudomonadota bacterium]
MIVPLKLLLFCVPPLPLKVLELLPPTPARAKELADSSGSAVTEPESSPFYSTVLVELELALTFSTICTVMVSPISRAR